MQHQVNRLQEEVLTAEHANDSLEEIHVQQNDHINKLFNVEKMKSKQVTTELNTERLGKDDALQQHVTEQTKKRLSDGNKDQNAVPLAAALPSNKKQKQNVSGTACDTGLHPLSQSSDRLSVARSLADLGTQTPSLCI